MKPTPEMQRYLDTVSESERRYEDEERAARERRAQFRVIQGGRASSGRAKKSK